MFKIRDKTDLFATKYYVTKIVMRNVRCSMCDGKKLKETRFRNKVYTSPCPACGGSGFERVFEEEKVPLKEALIELGVINNNKKDDE